MTTARRDSGAVGVFPIGHNQIILQVNVNDTIALKIKPRESGFFAAISSEFKSPSDITFSGQLLFLIKHDVLEKEMDEGEVEGENDGEEPEEQLYIYDYTQVYGP